MQRDFTSSKTFNSWPISLNSSIFGFIPGLQLTVNRERSLTLCMNSVGEIFPIGSHRCFTRTIINSFCSMRLRILSPATEEWSSTATSLLKKEDLILPALIVPVTQDTSIRSSVLRRAALSKVNLTVTLDSSWDSTHMPDKVSISTVKSMVSSSNMT